VELARTLLELGEHVAAAEAALEVLRVEPAPWQAYHFYGHLLAVCAGLAAKDANLPEARRRELTQTYGAEAVRMLREAITKGWNGAEELHKLPVYNPLRGRADFQQLLRELKPGTAKGNG
jgi:hypothetical protein